jgi:hypothetical protein
MGRRLLCIAAFVAVLAPRAARADNTYAEANNAFTSGEYAVAVELYESLVSAGVVHQELYYNLGNAYYRSGWLGPAIYNYERALRVSPAFDDARYNLAVAREAVAEKVVDRLKKAEGEPWTISVVTYFTIGELSVAFLLLNALFFGGLIVLRFISNGFARTAVLVSTVFVCVAFVASTVLMTGHALYLEKVRVGIVLPDQLHMREGADKKTATRSPVHAGLKVRIIREEPGWIQVRLANGAEGWVPEKSIGEL